jgi:hypothetical protein
MRTQLTRRTNVIVVAVAVGALVQGMTLPAAADTKCLAERTYTMAVTDPELCHSLESEIRLPSALPLTNYENKLDQFFSHYCHRNAETGWVRDKHVRQTGPYTARLVDGVWQGVPGGTHPPVMIWYSPEMAEWLRANRPAVGTRPQMPSPIPDGAVIVKEMVNPPGAACRDVDPLKLFPTNGITVMVRDRAASYDGWFWGFYGFGEASGWTPDWPPGDDTSLPNMGYAPYCLNCHASAQDNYIFADASNLEGEPGEPLVYLSQDAAPQDTAPSTHERRVLPPKTPPRFNTPLRFADEQVIAALRVGAQTMPRYKSLSNLPSQTYDNKWVSADGPDASDTFLTSSQCLGCHDANGTSLQFNMTVPSSHGDKLVNLSPYATWRTSPMGLAGRDPIFFAQLASETQSFHAESSALVQDTCLGCHGVTGQRQYHIDEFANSGDCPDFTRDIVDAVPWPPENPGAPLANYGMLARDGVSCTTCHRMVLGDKAKAAAADQPQNACVAKRQAFNNPDNTGFAKTFTGSFLVGSPKKLIGPFEKPRTKPMKNALGMTPTYDTSIKSSEICGTCHTVHLPVLQDGKVLTHVYEQTTYGEWAFSAYRTGKSSDGELPHGAGEAQQSCQDCHMPSREADGSPSRSKIASIQEHSNFPQTTNGLGPEDIDLEVREGFARHTLVGLNIFLLRMAQQFPDILGIPTQDPSLGDHGVSPLRTTAQAIIDQAATGTAEIALESLQLDEDALIAEIKVTSKTGHKFPSGVGFRRAFIEFSVFDQNGDTIWASGRTNAAGVLVDHKGEPLEGEHWWKSDCSGYERPGERPHQPHFQRVDRQDQAQIYQELVAAPPVNASGPVCGHDATPEGEFTTSFLSICAEVKDNRILPKGYLPVESRREIARALGAGDDLAEDAGPTAVGDDPDYVAGGGDSLTYRVALAELPKGAKPVGVEATLFYQATPPYYLQDRFCTARGPDTDRLYYIVGHLNLKGTDEEGWKLRVVSTGRVDVASFDE